MGDPITKPTSLEDVGALMKSVHDGQTKMTEANEKSFAELRAKQDAAEAQLVKLDEDHGARLKAFEEKMASDGVYGYGDNTDRARSKYQTPYSMTDFLRVVHSKTFGTKLTKEETSFAHLKDMNGGRDPYPVEHFEKVMASEVGTDGGYAVPTFMDDDLIERFKSETVFDKLGIRSLNVPEGFGPVEVPQLSSGLTFDSSTELGTPVVTTPQLIEKTASPHRLTAGVEIGNKLIASNAVNLDDLVIKDAMEDFALKADEWGFTGSGASGQPRGLINITGIESVSAGTPNGGPVTPDLLIELQRVVAGNNAKMRKPAYVTHSHVWFQLMKTVENSQHIFPSVHYGPGIAERPKQQIYSELLHWFNQFPTNLAEGSASNLTYLFFADWSELVRVMWGGFSVQATKEATHPTTGRSAFWNNLTAYKFEAEIDYYARHINAFAVASDVATS